MKMKLVAISIIAFGFSLSAAASARLTAFKKDIKPLLEKHCNRCHGGEKTKGDVDLTLFTSDKKILENSSDLLVMKDVLLSEDMPPKPKKTGFTEDHRKVLVKWVEDYIEKIDLSDPVYLDPGPSPIRQLTTDEYNRTIKSLLNVRFDINKEAGVKKESNVKAFSNLAATMQFSPLLMEKYFMAADKIIAHILDEKKGKNAREFLYGNIKGETDSQASSFLKVILSRAYRRTVSIGEVRRLLPMYRFLRKEGKSFQEALTYSLKPILVSPQFLQRIERNRARRNSPQSYVVTDLELASRLSYFLWSTMPDDDLFKTAAAKKLMSAEEITSQVNRMLKDEKASALIDNFIGEWLEFEKVNHALPGTRHFPQFNRDMKKTMISETEMFVREIIEKDLSVINLIDSDFTYLNDKLANLYNIPGVVGGDMRRVDLKPQHNRGGLLGMGSILAMTSHTDRTKPTARGKWVAEVILGTKIPEPPANVEALANDRRGASPTSFREKLNQHVADASCAVCHKKMDPLGFALDNFNAIGEWRDQERGKDVDTSGVLPDGTKVNGVAELKKVILSRKDQFVRNMFKKMLSYAIGRRIEYYDEVTIRKALENIKEADYKFSALVMEVVKSRPFLYRKNIENYFTAKNRK